MQSHGNGIKQRRVSDIFDSIISIIGLSALFSIILLYIIRNKIGIPFPDECVFSNPDTKGAIKCFNLVEDDTNLKWVMGTLNWKIFGDPEVQKAIEHFLKRKIPTEIIIGPNIDKNSKKLLKKMMETKNMSVWKMKENPERHFKVISEKHLFIEPKNHEPGEESTYMLLQNVKSMIKSYNKLFNEYKLKSEMIKLEKLASI